MDRSNSPGRNRVRSSSRKRLRVNVLLDKIPNSIPAAPPTEFKRSASVKSFDPKLRNHNTNNISNLSNLYIAPFDKGKWNRTSRNPAGSLLRGGTLGKSVEDLSSPERSDSACSRPSNFKMLTVSSKRGGSNLGKPSGIINLASQRVNNNMIMRQLVSMNRLSEASLKEGGQMSHRTTL